MKGFDFLFQREDHTLGIILQTWMAENPGFIAEDKLQFLDQIPREERETMEKILADAQQPK